VPGRGVQTLTAPLDSLSPSGVYSTRLLRSAYNGPVINVRRTSDDAMLDFVGDKFGNLSNTQSAVTIDTWLTSTTGNVTTWYDQAYSNNFIQVNTINQPQIVKNGGKWVLFFNRDATPTFYSNMYMTTNQTGIYSIMYNCNVSSTYNSNQTLLGSQFNDNRGFRFSNNLLYGDATQSGGRYGQDFLAAAGSYWYLNNQYGNMSIGAAGVASVVNPTRNNGVYTNGVWNYIIGVANGGMDSFPFNSINSPVLSLKGRAMYGYLSELVMFKTQLSDSQARSLYATQYISRGFITMTGTSLFTQLSQAATSSVVGAFSLRAVNGTSAKAVRVKRASDNAQQDFYADRLGNLLTTPVTGQTLQKWLGGAGANVVTWYDQSGYGNNATGSGSFIYQTSNVNMQWAVKSGSLLTVTSPSTFITNTNFTIHSITRRTTSSQAPGGGGTAPTNQAIYAHSGSGTASFRRIIALYDYQGNRFSFNSLNPTQYTVIGNTGCGLYSTTGPVDYLTVRWNGTTTQMYYNGSTSASTAAATFGNIPIASNFTLLGANAYGSIVGGEFGEIIVFNQALDTQDISKLYSAR